MNLFGKTVVLTGAGGGIGSVLAEKLHLEGAKLFLTSTEARKLDELRGKLAGTDRIFLTDFLLPNQIKELVDNIKRETDVVDILINAAGVGIYKSLEELSQKDWEDSFKINAEAPFLLIQKLLPLLQKSSESLVLNIGSGTGVIPQRNRSAYGASKFALRGLTLDLAEEFTRKSPRFCLITLGSTLTNFAGVPVEEKIKRSKEGHAYFTPEWVANKLIEIMKSDNRKVEYTCYPSDYGFGNWNKP